MLVGEQPGDREDIEGHPFVGPAGKILDRALEEAGIKTEQSLHHQHCQTFQFDSARQIANSQKAECQGDSRLPSLARC